MTGAPDLSVLLPARDAGRWVRFAVADVLAERAIGLELLAIDDGSRDSTRAWLERAASLDPRLRVLDGGGRGIAAALTRGLEASRAPLVGLMEADDRCPPDRWRRLSTALTEHPDWDGAVSKAALLGRSSDRMRSYLKWQNGLVEPEALASGRFVEIPALLQTGLFRRQILEHAGGFRDPSGWPCDIDLWMRLFAGGARIGRVRRVLYRWRQHGAQDTRTSPRHRLEALQRCKAQYFTAGPGADREIELVSTGKTLDTWQALLRAWECTGGREVRAHEWKPGHGPAPTRQEGAVRLFVFGSPEVRRRIRASTPGWDDDLDWFAA